VPVLGEKPQYWFKWDTCANCLKPPRTHIYGKCLFAETNYKLWEEYDVPGNIILHGPNGTLVGTQGYIELMSRV
jgi:hypothetical protein